MDPTLGLQAAYIALQQGDWLVEAARDREAREAVSETAPLLARVVACIRNATVQALRRQHRVPSCQTATVIPHSI